MLKANYSPSLPKPTKHVHIPMVGEGGILEQPAEERFKSFKMFTMCVHLNSRIFLFTAHGRLSAGLFRQATYGTVRMGIYQSLYDHFTRYYYNH